jgi:hypothetical protein
MRRCASSSRRAWRRPAPRRSHPGRRVAARQSDATFRCSCSL